MLDDAGIDDGVLVGLELGDEVGVELGDLLGAGVFDDRFAGEEDGAESADECFEGGEDGGGTSRPTLTANPVPTIILLSPVFRRIPKSAPTFKPASK